MMKGLECPYCDNRALKIWKFFVLPPLFLINITCMHCHKQIRLNWHALINVMGAIVIAGVVRVLVDMIYFFESILLDAVMYIFAAYLPFFFGQKLFLKLRENETESK